MKNVISFCCTVCWMIMVAAPASANDLDDVMRHCVEIDRLLTKGNNLPEKPPRMVAELIAQIRMNREDDFAQRMAHMRALAKDEVFVKRVVDDMPAGSWGSIWSEAAISRASPTLPDWQWFKPEDPLGTAMDRTALSRFFTSAATEARLRGNPALAARVRLVRLRYFVSDPLFLAGEAPNVLRAAKTLNLTVAETLGIDDVEAAKSVEDHLHQLQKAWSEGSSLSAPAALSCDRAIKQFVEKKIVDEDYEKAIDDCRALWESSSKSNILFSWQAANFLYRLRSMAALKGDFEQLKYIDGEINEMIQGTKAVLQRRLLTEVLSAKATLQDSSGVNVVSDPNDPIMKGVPPQ